MIYHGVTPLGKTILLSVCGIMLISYNMIEMTLPLIPLQLYNLKWRQNREMLLAFSHKSCYLYCTKNTSSRKNLAVIVRQTP